MKVVYIDIVIIFLIIDLKKITLSRENTLMQFSQYLKKYLFR